MGLGSNVRIAYIDQTVSPNTRFFKKAIDNLLF